jgi:hypothetical protein
MIVRSDQVENISASQGTEYHRKLARQLRANHREATARYTDAEMLKIIESAHERATGYGIRREEGVRKFITMAVLIHPNFDEDPTVKSYLKQPDLDPDFKIVKLADRVGKNIREQQPGWRPIA